MGKIGRILCLAAAFCSLLLVSGAASEEVREEVKEEGFPDLLPYLIPAIPVKLEYKLLRSREIPEEDMANVGAVLQTCGEYFLFTKIGREGYVLFAFEVTASESGKKVRYSGFRTEQLSLILSINSKVRRPTLNVWTFRNEKTTFIEMSSDDYAKLTCLGDRA